MSDPVFDVDNWEPMFKISKDMAVDDKGDFFMRMGDNTVMDMDSGEIRFTTPWDSDDGFEGGF